MTPQELAAALHLHPLVAELLIERGCDTVAAARAFLDPDHYAPTSPFELPDVDRAVAILRQAIRTGALIRIWGDFDVDGQTAVSVLLLGLGALGARVDYTIPNRQTHSHGLHLDGIRKAHAEGVAVLLTCDCGVADFEAVALAQSLGISVVITDHHELARSEAGEIRLPNASAVVNPNRLPEGHPLRPLPGVGVAYKLVEALRDGREQPELLDLVALGIVADVAWQRDEARYLLQRGLRYLRQTQRPGVRALARSAGVNLAEVNEDDIGFQLAPRLNAAGRLSTADLSVELLTTTDEARAAVLASQIETLNLERQRLQHSIEQEAFDRLRRDPVLARSAVIVLDDPRWHPSLIGVAASTVVSRTEKPAILISTPPGQLARASARSVPGIDIYAAIAAQRALLESVGGHPMAAGFSIRPEHIPAFREGIARYVGERLRQQPSSPRAESAARPLAWREISARLAEQLEQLAPFGHGNPRPLLRTEGLRLARVERIGLDGQHRALFLTDVEGTVRRAMWWRSAEQPLPSSDAVLSVTYTLRPDPLSRAAEPQIVIRTLDADGVHLRAANGSQAVLAARFMIHDLRRSCGDLAAIQRVLDKYPPEAIQVCSRLERPHWLHPSARWQTLAQLSCASVLVLWDTPPGVEAVAQALQQTDPQTVVLVFATDEEDQPSTVVEHVLGMLKVALRRGDDLDDDRVIARMAARVNQRQDTIRACIRWYRGETSQQEVIRHLLVETRAYRRYAREAPAEDLLRVAASALVEHSCSA